MLVPLARDLLTANSGKVALILVHDNVTCSLGKWLPLQAAKSIDTLFLSLNPIGIPFVRRIGEESFHIESSYASG
ncbi:hypothetical protein WJX75_009188 [Coccomyxa subellipsoidea]|uniref:Uncharacterized protein n=1 Tax=Coccomyxa subellipsoidea TaxID=248742 RepID=A0ABR2YAJ4_9CHLO